MASNALGIKAESILVMRGTACPRLSRSKISGAMRTHLPCPWHLDWSTVNMEKETLLPELCIAYLPKNAPIEASAECAMVGLSPVCTFHIFA